MFNKILLRPNAARNHFFDFGKLAEYLLFYQKTIIHVVPDDLITLINDLGIEHTIELMKRPEIEFHFSKSISLVSKSNNQNLYQAHIGTIQADTDEIFFNNFQKSFSDIDSKKYSERISPLIKVQKIPDNISLSLPSVLADKNNMISSVFDNVKFYNPYLDLKIEDIEFDLIFENGTNIKVETNIDFNNLQMVSESSILLNIAQTLEDMYFITENESEISLPEINSILIRNKVDSLLSKTKKSEDGIKNFKNHVYENIPDLQSVLNSKTKGVLDLFELLDNANKFKSWLSSIDDDKNVLNEYWRKVGEKNWIESTPSKAVRFYFLNSLGALLVGVTTPEIGIFSTIGLNAIDSFVLDKLGNSWKPNQFIEEQLKPFSENQQS